MPFLDRMGEAEQPRVQGLTGKGGNLRTDRTLASNRSPGTRAVDRVADQGMADMGEMNPDLMRPTRRKTALNNRCTGLVCLLDPVAGDCRFSLSLSDDSHFFAVRCAPTDIADDFSGGRNGYPPHNRGVGAVDPTCGEITG